MQRILIVSVSWIGDVIMSMPAVQALREALPDARLCLLAKPGMAALWKLHAAPDAVLLQERGCAGIARTIRRIRAEHPDTAYILPHSFRSAFLPFLAGVKTRVGAAGHSRDWMLTRRMQEPPDVAAGHQVGEYYHLFGLDRPERVPAPVLSIPDEAAVTIGARVAACDAPRIGFIPGAARGPSKQWPKAHFIELGTRLCRETGGSIILMGSVAEQALCRDIREGMQGAVTDFSGSTTLGEWAALLAACDVVVANDSGGMHLASAVGTPVVALYGTTDPAKTGPLGTRHTILQNSPLRARDVARDAREARRCLAAIPPSQVCEAVQAALRA
ncbi:MAG: lipopolysaccharide heptosyltransferase II [Spartobacteria bacterium]|nr:lipopolysaccharide heptosyltransferase II [Spartobacteria bacterium]